MKSDDQQLRDVMTREIRKVNPHFAKGVETGDSMKSYHEDFHTRSIRQMHNYQGKHRVVFCKVCPTKEKYGRRVYRRLHISFEADLLGVVERVVHAECYKCGFDMMLPAEKADFITSRVDEFEWNRVQGAFYELHLKHDVPLDTIFLALQKCGQEYELTRMQRNMTATEVRQRMASYQQELSRMQRQQMAPGISDRPRGLGQAYGGGDDMLDALRYQQGALSSARTGQAKR